MSTGRKRDELNLGQRQEVSILALKLIRRLNIVRVFLKRGSQSGLRAPGPDSVLARQTPMRQRRPQSSSLFLVFLILIQLETFLPSESYRLHGEGSSLLTIRNIIIIWPSNLTFLNFGSRPKVSDHIPVTIMIQEF